MFLMKNIEKSILDSSKMQWEILVDFYFVEWNLITQFFNHDFIIQVPIVKLN